MIYVYTRSLECAYGCILHRLVETMLQRDAEEPKDEIMEFV
jgi:hypothetical protein